MDFKSEGLARLERHGSRPADSFVGGDRCVQTFPDMGCGSDFYDLELRSLRLPQMVRHSQL
jgi:hypothetical protein